MADTIANNMYFIQSGTVAVFSKAGQEVNKQLPLFLLHRYNLGHPVQFFFQLCHLYDGNHFGEIALVLPNQKRIASVIAIETSSVYRLSRKDFLKAIIPFPDLLLQIEQIAKTRLQSTTDESERIYRSSRSSR